MISTNPIIEVNTYLLECLFETILGGLTTAEDFVARNPPEVGDSFNFVGQLLDLLKVVQHGRSLVDLGVGLDFFRHLEVFLREQKVYLLSKKSVLSNYPMEQTVLLILLQCLKSKDYSTNEGIKSFFE